MKGNSHSVGLITGISNGKNAEKGKMIIEDAERGKETVSTIEGPG